MVVGVAFLFQRHSLALRAGFVGVSGSRGVAACVDKRADARRVFLPF